MLSLFFRFQTCHLAEPRRCDGWPRFRTVHLRRLRVRSLTGSVRAEYAVFRQTAKNFARERMRTHICHYVVTGVATGLLTCVRLHCAHRTFRRAVAGRWRAVQKFCGSVRRVTPGEPQANGNHRDVSSRMETSYLPTGCYFSFVCEGAICLWVGCAFSI